MASRRQRAQAIFTTERGQLYEADCLDVLPMIKPGTVDTVFADPPFNLRKDYGGLVNDGLSDAEYIKWCRKWLKHCIRVLRPGGALFVYNLPKWNVLIGHHLMQKGMELRHWIAIEHKSSLPIQSRLYPAHYSLLYFTKGKPAKFQKIRTPIETCRHCGGEVRDYGGHRHAMNPNGVNLKDVWTDIPPVRHRKFKPGLRQANALSTKLVERVVELSTLPGDLVLDPFGGSGTTYAVCEKRRRRWIGIEIESTGAIVERLQGGGVDHHRNEDYVEARLPHLAMAI